MDDSGVPGEKLGLSQEDEVVKKVKDPKLPSQPEVDQHWIMGHLPYRDWCPICVKAQGRDGITSRIQGGKENSLNIVGIIVFQEMN